VSGLRIAFLIDPIETLIVGHDTSLAFMLECQRRGHEVHYFEQKDLEYRDGEVRASARRVELKRSKGDHYRIISEGAVALETFDAIFLRKDPPVDVEYLHATQMVELASRPVLVNDPSALRSTRCTSPISSRARSSAAIRKRSARSSTSSAAR
jgi:glutathione synthase